MKKAARFIATVIIVCVVVILLNLFLEGVPLLGTPKVEYIQQVIVEHSSYPNDVRVYTDENNIKLSEALLVYLRYDPLKKLTDDAPDIQITYVMNDGTVCIVKANDKTVWWNGKPRAVHDEGMFTKLCTAVFFLRDHPRAIEGNLKTYYEMPNGTWQVNGYTYKYKLEISGTQPLAEKDTTYVILSNKEDISFHEAMMASGLSSNMDDYFAVEDAVFVEIY